ncbi:hypothetical protein ACHAXM_002715, partial [Skeletonema potamos]
MIFNNNTAHQMLSFLLLLTTTTIHVVTSTTHVESARHIKIFNQSGRRISISWIHPKTGQRTIQHSKPDILNGAKLELDSFVSHEFEVLELPSKRTKLCIHGEATTTTTTTDEGGGEEDTCRKVYFTVNSNQNQVVYIREGVNVEHTDSYTIASERAERLLERCKLDARERMMEEKITSRKKEEEDCKEPQNEEIVMKDEQEQQQQKQGFFSKLWYYGSKSSSNQNNYDDDDDSNNDNVDTATKNKNSEILEQLTTCVQTGIAAEIERANEEIAFQANIREEMADYWENYTC